MLPLKNIIDLDLLLGGSVIMVVSLKKFDSMKLN